MIRLIPLVLFPIIFIGGDDPSVDSALQEVFVRLADRVSASIVTISPERWVEVRREGTPRGIPPPTGRYFQRPDGPGSGVVVSRSGHVLTSHYLLGEDPGRIVITAPDGSVHEGRLIDRNPELDLALLQAVGLPVSPIPLALDRPVRVGQSVVVVGRGGPGESPLVTTGIVSALGRMGGSAIQVDAGIVPGNLGGAIVNLRGELIGIPGLFHRRLGWNSGVGLAAPAGPAAAWVEEAGGKVSGGESLPEDDLLAAALLFERAVLSTVERALAAFVKVGGGSGVCISPEGEVLTNHHVVGGNVSWEVTFPSGERYPARLLGTDPLGDLALLQIEGGEDFPYIPLGGAEQIQAGRFALAFGNPFGLAKGGAPSVTLGVISAIHRYQGEYGDSIQVDTPINPGNSGGPLLDIEGRLIGICGRMAWRVEFAPRVSTGAGFAIPVTQIRNFLPILRKEGAEAAHGEVEGLSLGWEAGSVVVSEIEEGSAAEKAGFEVGDVILRAADERVTTPDRCRGILSTHPAGTSIRFRIRRDDQALDLVAALGGKPFSGHGGKPREGLPEPFIGITYGRTTLAGVEVWEVVPGSPAAKAGVRKGDRITAFRGKAAQGPLQLEADLMRCPFGKEVELVIFRDGRSHRLELRVINSLDYRRPVEGEGEGDGDGEGPGE